MKLMRPLVLGCFTLWVAAEAQAPPVPAVHPTVPAAYNVFTVLFAGGGIKGGHINAMTDALGEKIIGRGRDAKRSVCMEDIAGMLYSALRIDSTKSIEHAPSNRAFWSIEPFASRQLVRSREISLPFV